MYARDPKIIAQLTTMVHLVESLVRCRAMAALPLKRDLPDTLLNVRGFGRIPALQGLGLILDPLTRKL